MKWRRQVPDYTAVQEGAGPRFGEKPLIFVSVFKDRNSWDTYFRINKGNIIHKKYNME
jgi:hypothetical protein